MHILSSLFSFGHSTLSYIVPFLIVLTVVVFFHELGHFLVARFFGVKVEAFSIGFGPELFGWLDRYGTRWRVSAIPLGGYVKFLGDENASSKPEAMRKLDEYDEETRKRLFQLKPVGQRAAVVVAGPVANFILTIAIFSVLFMTVGKAIIEPRIGEVVQGSPSQAAGFVAGDKILNVDGNAIESFSEIQRYVATSNGRPLRMQVERDHKNVDLTVTPRFDTVNQQIGGEQKVWMIGLRSQSGYGLVKFERYDPFTAIMMGAKETWFIIDRTLLFIHDLFAGNAPVKELGGPIRIAQVSGEAAGVGPFALISLTAILSVSIGLLNLFPIPMLDGGHLVFYAIEAVRRRPLSEKVQEIGFRIGLALVLTLMVLATWNDITRLIGL
jgi:regulator of sigma E protease